MRKQSLFVVLLVLVALLLPLSVFAAEGHLHVFATSTSYSGDVNGLDGADFICQQAAADKDSQYNPTKVYKAWLSSGTLSLESRFDADDTDWEKVEDLLPEYRTIEKKADGTIKEHTVALNWDDLASGAGVLFHPVQYNEFGEAIDISQEDSTDNVWARNDQKGVTGDDCKGWSESTNTLNGNVGSTGTSSKVPKEAWDDLDVGAKDQPCNLVKRLYCVEDFFFDEDDKPPPLPPEVPQFQGAPAFGSDVALKIVQQQVIEPSELPDDAAAVLYNDLLLKGTVLSDEFGGTITLDVPAFLVHIDPLPEAMPGHPTLNVFVSASGMEVLGADGTPHINGENIFTLDDEITDATDVPSDIDSFESPLPTAAADDGPSFKFVYESPAVVDLPPIPGPTYVAEGEQCPEGYVAREEEESTSKESGHALTVLGPSDKIIDFEADEKNFRDAVTKANFETQGPIRTAEALEAALKKLVEDLPPTSSFAMFISTHGGKLHDVPIKNPKTGETRTINNFLGTPWQSSGSDRHQGIPSGWESDGKPTRTGWCFSMATSDGKHKCVKFDTDEQLGGMASCRKFLASNACYSGSFTSHSVPGLSAYAGSKASEPGYAPDWTSIGINQKGQTFWGTVFTGELLKNVPLDPQKPQEDEPKPEFDKAFEASQKVIRQGQPFQLRVDRKDGKGRYLILNGRGDQTPTQGSVAGPKVCAKSIRCDPIDTGGIPFDGDGVVLDDDLIGLIDGADGGSEDSVTTTEENKCPEYKKRAAGASEEMLEINNLLLAASFSKGGFNEKTTKPAADRLEALSKDINRAISCYPCPDPENPERGLGPRHNWHCEPHESAPDILRKMVKEVDKIRGNLEFIALREKAEYQEKEKQIFSKAITNLEKLEADLAKCDYECLIAAEDSVIDDLLLDCQFPTETKQIENLLGGFDQKTSFSVGQAVVDALEKTLQTSEIKNNGAQTFNTRLLAENTWGSLEIYNNGDITANPEADESKDDLCNLEIDSGVVRQGLNTLLGQGDCPKPQDFVNILNTPGAFKKTCPPVKEPIIALPIKRTTEIISTIQQIPKQVSIWANFKGFSTVKVVDRRPNKPTTAALPAAPVRNIHSTALGLAKPPVKPLNIVTKVVRRQPRSATLYQAPSYVSSNQYANYQANPPKPGSWEWHHQRTDYNAIRQNANARFNRMRNTAFFGGGGGVAYSAG